jgi:bifunctional non-homologous end joining protein LigD
MRAVVLRRANRSPSAASLPKARRAPFPAYIEPCDPTLKERPPKGDWLYEVKADGYRAQVHFNRGKVTVYSRNGLDWTDEFSRIADAAKYLTAREAVIDGEAVVLGKTGLPDFQALRRELGKGSAGRLEYHAFDLLYLDGFDLRNVDYLERKRLLQELLTNPPPGIMYVEYLEADGEQVLKHACRMGLEGVVVKRPDAPYRSGRQDSWIKLKCVKSDTFPIVAFVEKLGANPRKIASLYLGRSGGDRITYAGKARSGYTEQIAREVRERLDPLIIKASPLSEALKKPKATWVRPEVNAEIQYGGITDDGLLREAVFKGLRDDLATPTVHTRTQPKEDNDNRHGVPRENILQLLPDAPVPSKAEFTAYWRKVHKRALKYLGHRPLKLVRHVHGTTFYHKGPLPPIPEAVHQLKVQKREGGEGTRLWVDSLQGLLGLVEIGAVELHPWNATVDDIEHPDTLVFDLDPGEGIEWEFVIDTAVQLRELLAKEGLESWPKLTGGKGVHLMVPIAPEMTHDAAHRYCRELAERLVANAPERYTVSASMTKRADRLFIDYLRNGRGTTAVGTYSPRARPGFPIAAPVTWKQVEAGERPDAFTTKRMPAINKGRV